MTVADPSAPGGTGLVGDPKFADQEPALTRVFRSLDLPDTFSVLDVGCGFGRMHDLLGQALPGRRFSYDGVDVDPGRLTVFHDRLWERRENRARPPRDWVALFPWDADAFLDWATDGRWDLVLAVELLMHLPADRAYPLASRLASRATYLVTCDWDAPSPRAVAAGNYLHDYGRMLPPHQRYPAGPYQSVRVHRGDRP